MICRAVSMSCSRRADGFNRVLVRRDAARSDEIVTRRILTSGAAGNPGRAGALPPPTFAQWPRAGYGTNERLQIFANALPLTPTSLATRLSGSTKHADRAAPG